MKSNKNGLKRKYSDLNNFIVDDSTDDSADSDYFNDNSNSKIISKYAKSHDKIKKIIKSQNISMNDVFNLELSEDENIWFFEKIKIRNNCDINTEQYYAIKNLIWKKYINLKNIDTKKLKEIKSISGIDSESNVNDNIISKILNSNHTNIVKSILYKKFKMYCESTNSSDEQTKVIEWINTVLELPSKNHPNQINNKILISNKLSILWNKLNQTIFGLTDVKEKIMEMMCSKLLNDNNKGKIITFVGPPGVGKTAMSLSIAESLNMPFDQISFGSVKDSNTLIGHSSTYIGSVPGLFTKILLKSKRLDTVVLLDEIDKIPPTSEGSSVESVLLHVLDKTQNNRFRDMYMPEINLDLSEMVFLCAANSIDNIDPILKDRMTIIEIKGYDNNEKTEIAFEHLFPRISKESGFDDNELIIEKHVLNYLICNKTEFKCGMREVERNLYKLCERLSLLKYSNNIKLSYNLKKISFPYKITIDTINELI